MSFLDIHSSIRRSVFVEPDLELYYQHIQITSNNPSVHLPASCTPEVKPLELEMGTLQDVT